MQKQSNMLLKSLIVKIIKSDQEYKMILILDMSKRLIDAIL